MKIQSSNVWMDAACSASQTIITETTVVDYYEENTKYTSQSDPSMKSDPLSIQDQAKIMDSGKPEQLFFISLKDCMSADGFTQKLHEQVFHYIIKQMKDLHRRNFISFPDTGSALTGLQAASAGSGNQIWYHQETTQTTYSEYEAATFDTAGIVRTSDGREIPFNLSLSLSRSFQEFTSITEESMGSVTMMQDPLVINMDIPSAYVQDQSFLFDIDCDGKKESISMLGKGSGFLALDKNNDGVINNGNELFGTQSGDGFADLVSYDSDGNGWIDENDPIFNSLKVWTKDSEGKDQLFSLKEADVGAIFLGSVSTGFDLKDDENNTNARIQSTGIYLHESTGTAGTIQHVDFAI